MEPSIERQSLFLWEQTFKGNPGPDLTREEALLAGVLKTKKLVGWILAIIVIVLLSQIALDIWVGRQVSKANSSAPLTIQWSRSAGLVWTPRAEA